MWELSNAQRVLQNKTAKIIRTRWAICNKGDAANPDVRARLVAQELNTYKSDEFFASTPPLEAKRLSLSELTTKKTTEDGRALEVSFVDIEKAYSNGIPNRELHLFLPREMGQGTRAVARLTRCVYGTRDAGMIWEETYSQALIDMGFRRGLASPCCFHNSALQVSVVIHGDDFTALGPREGLVAYEKALAKHSELKIRGRLGLAADCDGEVRVLNRVVRLDKEEGLKYEAGPRHVEMLVRAAGLEAGNVRAAPGSKADEVNYDALLADADLAQVQDGHLDGDLHEHELTQDPMCTSAVPAPNRPPGSILLPPGSLGSTTMKPKEVTFSPLPDLARAVQPYSLVYGRHPSSFVVTSRGMKMVSSLAVIMSTQIRLS